MKKPKYMEELLKIIFLWLGIMFMCGGVLTFSGVMKPGASSTIQNSTLLGSSFLLISLFFAVISVILGIIARKRDKLYSELLTSGTKVKGRVEKVYLQEYTHYGRQSPYRIRYSYSYKDKVYHHKSYFIWEKPHLTSGDTVMICVNDFGKSTILL